jgi:hypothetical protein
MIGNSWNCSETSDNSGEPICALHGEPLREQSVKSQLHNPTGAGYDKWLICPVSGQQLKRVY